MSDLVVSADTPALTGGHELRTYAIVRALCALGPVDLLYAQFGASEPSPEFRSTPGLTLHRARPTRGARRLASYARARLGGVPDGFARGVSPELVDRAHELAGDPGRGRVIADGPVVAGALRALARRRPVIYNAHNLEAPFAVDSDGGDTRNARRMERFERGLIENAAESWMVGPTDVDAARALVPGARVRYVPNVVDVASIRPVTYPAGERRVLFVANFTYAPNLEGLRFLIDEVLPHVWQEIPDARLAVVGRGLEGPPSGDPRVESLGFVADLPPVYATADCVTVPMLRSSRSPLKFVEALAYRVPVVATPTAASGLEVTAGEDYLEGDCARAFAAAIAVALRGEAAGIAARGRALAERAYSIESLVDRLAA
ncbi:MAG: glycosyltransferase [Solirubrobacterales bacterium]